MSDLAVSMSAFGVKFGVHVQPRASRTEIAGIHGSALKVRLHSPPVDGAANQALVEFLSARLGVSKRAVSIVAGHSSRAKIVQVEGVSAASIQSLVEGADSK